MPQLAAKGNKMTFQLDPNAVEFDSGVPIPERVPAGKPEKYPFSRLAVGQSFRFFVPDTEAQKAFHNLTHASYVAAKRAAKDGEEKKFVVRLVKEDNKSAVRVWRAPTQQRKAA